LIATLERHLKRAARKSQAAVGTAYQAISQDWRAHIQWVRMKVAYFRPVRLNGHLKREQIRWIDQLCELAKEGSRQRGYSPPAEEVLRHRIRLLLQYARRGRAKYLINLRAISDQERRYFLSHFLLQRLDLNSIKNRSGN
jgi:hypothetical protein